MRETKSQHGVLLAALIGWITVGAVADSAHAAVISSVQTGTLVSSVNGTSTVTITSVDPTRSILFFEARHNSNRPVGSMVRGRIATATTLQFARVTDDNNPVPITIRWYVAEFTSGVRVQRGETDQLLTVNDVTLPIAVGAVDHAFVTWSKTPLDFHTNNLDGDDPTIGELTSTTNLQFRVTTSGTGMTIWWQVVEFTNAPDVLVQKGNTALVNGALSVPVTLPTAVNPATTFVLVGYNVESQNATNGMGPRMLRAQLIDSTTILIDRSIAGGNNDDIVQINWQVVDLRDGSEVIRGSASLATGVAQTAVGLGRTVNVTRAVAFASVQPTTGQSMGRTALAGNSQNDFPGVCSVTMALAPTTVTLERANTASTCDVGWFVVHFAPTLVTAVSLTSFTAAPADREVRLDWETGAEINNLGFHLYRAESSGGPWARITPELVRGLGSSPDGARYSYRDRELVNGSTYYYLLEDVETTGRTKRHGPVSATPQAGAAPAGPAESTAAPKLGPRAPERWIRYGEPEATSFRIVRRNENFAIVELTTGGFYALPDGKGGVLLSIPGFEETRTPGAPALPVKLAWIEAVAGRRVALATVLERETVSFGRLRPAVTGEPELRAGADGSVIGGVRRSRAGVSFRQAGLYPEAAAVLRSVAFQQDVKKALLELAPLRWDRTRGRLRLARRLQIHVSFAGEELAEESRGGARGHARRRSRERISGSVLARLVTQAHGLQAVGFEQLFGAQGPKLAVSELRLSRQGETVAHHVEPAGRLFGPGSVLYFVSGDPELNPHGRELVYELSREGGGLPMPLANASPRGTAVSHAWSTVRFEVNRFYQPGLLQAESSWLWDVLQAPSTKSYPFELTRTVAGQPARLAVWLQGSTDVAAAPDHRVRVAVNGHVVGEVVWDGQKPHRLDGEVPPGILVDGANRLEIESILDAGVQQSQAFLDRYELQFARHAASDAGSFEGSFSLGGTAEIQALPVDAPVLDTTEPAVKWLVGAQATPLGTRLRVEAGRSILAVAPSAILRPEVRTVRPTRLRGRHVRSDYLVLGPREFLAAAQPLLELRESQGLDAMAVAVEDAYDEFGHGEAHPEAIRDFLEHAFHGWARAPRYVLLLGDASFDFKDHMRTGLVNRVPPYMIQDAYLRTVSDPAYASVNGEDALPDFAIGRLPAQSVEQAQALVRKLVDWEGAGFDLSGRAVLVADNSDAAGDFEGDSDFVASTLLADRPVEKIYLSRLGADTRPSIVAAFDAGAALLSYLGHGGTAVWASENIWNNWDAPSLSPQGEQPFLLAMDCLNGYFHHPVTNALGEELLKAEGKGVIGALVPSSLSVHWAARVYHEALVRELTSGRHERLGDAVLAAQAAYVESGARPDLLQMYQLLADPGLRIRR